VKNIRKITQLILLIVLSMGFNACSQTTNKIHPRQKIVYKIKYIKQKKRIRIKYKEPKKCKITDIKIYERKPEYFLVNRIKMRKCFMIMKYNMSIIQTYRKTI